MSTLKILQHKLDPHLVSAGQVSQSLQPAELWPTITHMNSLESSDSEVAGTEVQNAKYRLQALDQLVFSNFKCVRIFLESFSFELPYSSGFFSVLPSEFCRFLDFRRILSKDYPSNARCSGVDV